MCSQTRLNALDRISGLPTMQEEKKKRTQKCCSVQSLWSVSGVLVMFCDSEEDGLLCSRDWLNCNQVVPTPETEFALRFLHILHKQPFSLSHTHQHAISSSALGERKKRKKM